MNECIFFGRFANEPKKQIIKKGDKELPVVNFKIAVDREYWGGRNSKDFLPMAAYGKMADIIYDHFKMGSKILCKCIAQSDSKNFYTIQFNVSRVYFCDPQTVIEHDGDIDEIIVPPNFDGLEEIEEEPPTLLADEKPQKRSKKTQG